MANMPWNIIKLSYIAAALGGIPPFLWGCGMLTSHHPRDGSIIGAAMDGVMYLFPCVLIGLIVPTAGTAVTIILFVIAALCNVVLYGILSFILLKVAGFICGIF